MKTSAAVLARILFFVSAASESVASEANPVSISQGRILTMREPGKAQSRPIRLRFEPFSLAATAKGVIMYVNDTCHQRGEIRFRSSNGQESAFTELDSLFNGARARVDSLTLAPSGRSGAFVVRTCPEKRVQEVSDQVGLVYVISPGDLRPHLVRGSRRADGLPLGMPMDPKFSPDEKELLVNFEAGFEVFNLESGNAVFRSTAMSISSEGWMGATGWLSGSCIAFRFGSEWPNRDVKPPMTVNWRTATVLPLGAVTGAANETIVGLSEVASEYGLRNRDALWELVSLRTGATVMKFLVAKGHVAFAATAATSTGLESLCDAPR